ncbi:MAG: TolC family protein [Planctomycetes bacterium]|nr:TolC family protein [Planctomycetota bacterium]
MVRTVCILLLLVLASCKQTQTVDMQGDTTSLLGSTIERSQSTTEDFIVERDEVLILTLDRAIDRALVANRGLIAAGDQVDSSRLSLVAAESQFELKFRPRASVGFGKHSTNGTNEEYGAGLTIDKRFETGTSVAVTPRVDKVSGGYQSGVDVTLSQPLLLGTDQEYNMAAVDSAEFSGRAAKRSLFLTRVNTVVSTVMLMYRVVQQREVVALSIESTDRLEHLVIGTRAKEKIGLATSIDTLRGELQLRHAQDTLVNAKESYGDALDDLRVQLSLPMDQLIEVDAPLVYTLVEVDENTAVQIAMTNRVELEQAQDNFEESQRFSRIAKHRTLPSLDLVFGYSQVGVNENLLNDFGLDDHVWNVNLVTSTDFARTAEKAAYEQSLLGIRSAKRSLELQQDDIARQVKRDLRNLRRAQKQITIQEEQIVNSEKQMRLAKIKFDNGLANNFDLVEAEADLRQAETKLVSSVVNYIVGTYQIRQSLGTLLQEPEVMQ